MQTRFQIQRSAVLSIVGILVSLMPIAAAASSPLPPPVTIDSGWQLQDASKVPQPGAAIALPDFKPQGWYAATVPGTVLTSLVNNGVYRNRFMGRITVLTRFPRACLARRYWYRTVFEAPKAYKGRHVWLNLEGINYSAEIWVDGKQIGSMRGAFKRGIFDISTIVKPGKKAALAVLVTPQPHPGEPHEHTIRDGLGLNGGITAIDGPTFLSTIGWDWIPAIRDRDTGIWRKVFLSATGPVVVKNPLVTTDLPLPKTDSSDVSVQATVENVTDAPQKGVLHGSFGDVSFQQPVEVAPHSSQVVSFTPQTTPAACCIRFVRPQESLYASTNFDVDGKPSDGQGCGQVRKITYAVADFENLTISVNGVRVFVRGGDWGLDEAMKRIPRERLEAQIRMHQIANMNMIRNWVGQSTGEDFYELCDKYGLLIWDEFFQPNPSDGPNPTDLDTYMANVRDKILRFRNHPSIAVWCARNEGNPPKEIDDALRAMMAELEPTRLYQANSADGRGVHSGGPYHWRTPREFYIYDAAFKTETGSVSVPTLESVHGMMPQKDWEIINDDWAEHDFAKGASGSDTYPAMIASRYGKVANLADFVRKAQLANYEAFRAMYEGRAAKLFNPSTGIITWMSNPAQPSFVWQIYHHDLEANSSLFAVKKASEQIHIQLNESTGEVQVINNQADAVANARAHITIYNLDGSVQYQHDYDVTAPASLATSLGAVEWPAGLSAVHFVKLELHDAAGKLLSDNFYWRGLPEHLQDDLTALNTLPTVALDAKVASRDAEGKTLVTITLHNPGSQIALMAHLQLRRGRSGERVLPAYYTDNYVSLAPDESRTITIEAATADLKGEQPLVVVDGWNIAVTASSSAGAAIALNTDAQVDHWPVTGLPMISGR